MRTINGPVRKAVLQALACASGLVLAAPGRASADSAQFDIAAQPMPSALKNFAAQAKMQLLYRYDVVGRATAKPVAGRLEKHVALEKLLQGTGLEAIYSDGNIATIRPAATEEKPVPASKAATGDTPRPANSPPTGSTVEKWPGSLRLAQTGAGAGARAGQDSASNDPPGSSGLAEVVIVGVRRA